MTIHVEREASKLSAPQSQETKPTETTKNGTKINKIQMSLSRAVLTECPRTKTKPISNQLIIPIGKCQRANELLTRTMVV